MICLTCPMALVLYNLCLHPCKESAIVLRGGNRFLDLRVDWIITCKKWLQVTTQLCSYSTCLWCQINPVLTCTCLVLKIINIYKKKKKKLCIEELPSCLFWIKFTTRIFLGHLVVYTLDFMLKFLLKDSVTCD